MKKLIVSLLAPSLFALGSGSAAAQDILIRGATVHPLTARGTLGNADVLIRDGKIHSVGTGLSAEGATTVDAKGRALTPGMFAGLSTIGIQEVQAEGATDDAALALGAPAYEMQWRPEFDVTTAYNGRSVLVPVTRIEGLTWTVLSPHVAEAGANFLAGQGAAVTLDGRQDAVLDGSRSLFIDLGGTMNDRSGGSRAAQWMILEQAVHETRTRLTGDKTLMHPLGREVFARYLQGGRVVFDVNRAADILKTLAFAKRYGIKAVIVGGAEAWIVADELAEAKVPVILDALVNLPDSFDQIGARLDNAALLHKAGVKIAFTHFSESHNARKVRQVAGNAAAHGLPKDVALAGLTSNAADIFGLGGSRGRIAAGQVADVVLWSGDPLEVTSVAEQVWINGRAIEMRSRQHELRDRYLERLKQAQR
jgi:imidazolonepropionase-like amidohydrolase